MKKNFRKAGPASLALLFATVLAAALVFAGCSSSSDDGDSSSKSSAAVSQITQTFTPEPGANFLTVELNGGSFKKDVKLSDFAFGETRSSTFGTNLGSGARLTKGTAPYANVYQGAGAGVLTKVYITGLRAADTDGLAGVQTLTIKASALAVQPQADAGGVVFPNGVHIETGTTVDVVAGPFTASVVDDDVLVLTVPSGIFVDELELTDFELLQKDGEKTGYYAPYDPANGGFTTLAGSTIVKDADTQVRFNGLPPIAKAGAAAYLRVKPEAQAMQIGSTISPVITLLPDGTYPRYLGNDTGRWTVARTLTKNPRDWVGQISVGITQVAIPVSNAQFKPIEVLRANPNYFQFDKVAGGFELTPDTTISWAGTNVVLLSGLKAVTLEVEQQLTIAKEAFAWWTPGAGATIANIDINPVAVGGAVIESAQYAMTNSNLLIVELPKGGQFISAAALASRLTSLNTTTSKPVTYEAEVVPPEEGEGWGWAINMPYNYNTGGKNVNVANLFPGGTGTFASGITGNGVIRRIRVSSDLTKIELYATRPWAGDNIEGDVTLQKSTLTVNSAIVLSSPGGVSISSGKEKMRVPFTVGADGANTLTVSVTLTGTPSGSLNGKLFSPFGRDWQTVTVKDAATHAAVATLPVRVAYDLTSGGVNYANAFGGTVLYGTTPAESPLAAGSYYAEIGELLQSRLEQKTFIVPADAAGTGPASLSPYLYVTMPDNLAEPYTRMWAVAGSGNDVNAPLALPTNNGDNTLTVTLTGGTFRGWAGYGAGTPGTTSPQAYDVGNLVRVTDFSVDGTQINFGTLVLVNANTARIYDIKPALPAGLTTVNVKKEAIVRTGGTVAASGTAASALSYKSNFRNDGTAALNIVASLEGATWVSDPATGLPAVGSIAEFLTTLYTPAAWAYGDNPDYYVLDASVPGTPILTAWGDNKAGTRLVLTGTPSNTAAAITVARNISRWNATVYLTIPSGDGIIVRDGTPVKLTAKLQ